VAILMTVFPDDAHIAPRRFRFKYKVFPFEPVVPDLLGADQIWESTPFNAMNDSFIFLVNRVCPKIAKVVHPSHASFL
jgi:hypothetical protein